MSDEGRPNLGFEKVQVRVQNGRVAVIVGFQRQPYKHQGSVVEILHLWRDSSTGEFLATMELLDREDRIVKKRVRNQARTVEELFFGKGGYYARRYQKLFDMTGLDQHSDGGERWVQDNTPVYNERITVAIT